MYLGLVSHLLKWSVCSSWHRSHVGSSSSILCSSHFHLQSVYQSQKLCEVGVLLSRNPFRLDQFCVLDSKRVQQAQQEAVWAVLVQTHGSHGQQSLQSLETRWDQTSGPGSTNTSGKWEKNGSWFSTAFTSKYLRSILLLESPPYRGGGVWMILGALLSG